MRFFVTVLSFIGLFVFLVSQYSFWPIFGAMYAAGMVLVVLVACVGQRSKSLRPVWSEALEAEKNPN